MWRWREDGANTPGVRLGVQRIEKSHVLSNPRTCIVLFFFEDLHRAELLYSLMLVETGWLSYYCLPHRAVSGYILTVAGLRSGAVTVAVCMKYFRSVLIYSLSAAPNKITVK